MTILRIVGIILIVLGVLGLVYGSVTYTQRSRTTEIGALEIAVNEKKTVNVPVWAGLAAILAGGVLIFIREKRH